MTVEAELAAGEANPSQRFHRCLAAGQGGTVS
jgi:hypothetical protein